jgi:hypothetical protein
VSSENDIEVVATLKETPKETPKPVVDKIETPILHAHNVVVKQSDVVKTPIINMQNGATRPTTRNKDVPW